MKKTFLSAFVFINYFLSISAVESRSYYIHGVDIVVCAGDIAQQQVDVIVNAANFHMLGGAGVDGAIQKAAGCQLVRYSKTHFPIVGTCDGLPVRCPLGTVKVTPSFNLISNGIRYIIHANGPQGVTKNREQYLRSCYTEAIKAACNKELLSSISVNDSGIVTSIAFPAISVGIYGYPLKEATECAVKAIIDTLALQHEQGTLSLHMVKIVLFEKDPNFVKLFRFYTQALDTYTEQKAIKRSCGCTGGNPKSSKRTMVQNVFSCVVDYIMGAPTLLLSKLTGRFPIIG